VRPDFDVAAFARESEARIAVAAHINPTMPAPAVKAAEVTVPKTADSTDRLRALLEREDPF
jgi:hypothetical protein